MPDQRVRLGQAGAMAATLVSFHAHPDDEAILVAGTLARAASEGHRTVLVFATRGEVGELDAAMLSGGETIAQRRTREAEASAELLGVQRVVFLDFPDSGHIASEVPPGAFARTDVDLAAARLASVLTEEGAEVLTTYDRNGGYGHPDHVQVHHVGRRAGELAGTPNVLEATFDRGLLELAAQLLPGLDGGPDLPDQFEVPDTSGWYSDSDEITHRVDVTDFLHRKRASMAAHASQASSDGGLFRTLATFVALPDDWFAMAFGTEWFVDPRADGGQRFDWVFPQR